MSRILLVGAHPDDVEMNAGGSIHKWATQGRAVEVVIMATAEGSPRYEESLEACNQLHVQKVHVLGGRDTSLHDSFHRLMGGLEMVLHTFQPDTLITHFHADTHQDHVSTYKVAVAAARKVQNFMMFKPTYPSGRPDIPFHPQVTSLLTVEDMNAKVNAINCFASQRTKYGDENWAEAMRAVSRGDAWTYAGVHGYAEVFQLGRLIV